MTREGDTSSTTAAGWSSATGPTTTACGASPATARAPSTAIDSVGALCFADAEVGIEQLGTEIRHAPRRLAILLACESLLTSSSLPNETLGLPSALLQLGFAGVIATDRRRDVRADRMLSEVIGHRLALAGLDRVPPSNPLVAAPTASAALTD